MTMLTLLGGVDSKWKVWDKSQQNENNRYYMWMVIMCIWV